MTGRDEVSDAEVAAVDVAKLCRARKLFGWPVRTLDDLADLRERVHKMEITVDRWRADAAALRRDMPGAPDAHELAVVTKAAGEAMFAEWDTRELDGPAARLMHRLVEFNDPPTDEALWADLADFRKRARGSAPVDQRTAYSDRAHHLALLLTRNGTTHDMGSGLPWVVLGRYRWVDFERAGVVPAPLDVARERAELAGEAGELAEVVLEQASLLTGRAGRDRTSFAGTNAMMLLHFLTGLSAELRSAGAPRTKGHRQLLEEFDQVWSSPAMTAFLLERTSAGWPKRYARAPRPAAVDGVRA